MAKANTAVHAPLERLDTAVIAFIFVALAGIFPYFPGIHSANELSRLYLAQALVDSHSVSIDDQLRLHGDISDKAIREGRHYSDKAPGVAFIALPAIWLHHATTDSPTLATDVRLARLCVSTLPTVALLFALLAFLRSYVPDASVRRSVLIAYGLGSLATTYSIVLFGHQVSAACLFLGFMCARAEPQGRAWPAIGLGAFASLAVAIEYPNAILFLPIGIYFLMRVRMRPSAIAYAAVGAVPMAIAVALYHQAAFGSPFATGYSFLDNHFASVHAQGFMGISAPRIDHAVLSFVSPAKGIFYYSPFLLFALPGLFYALKLGRDGLLAVVMVTLSALIVCSMVYPNGGWTVSQRHLTPAVPWLLLPVALTLQKHTWSRGIFAALAIVSITLTWLSTVVWPHYMDELTNPFFDVGVGLMRDGFFPPSIWNAVGVSTSVAAALVLLIATGSLLAFAAQRAGKLTRVASLSIALLLPVVWLAGASQLSRAGNVAPARSYIEANYVRDSATNAP